ncbi:MAG: fatty acid desaturase [Chloroherpetonaceae bacterium]|nr:fatty acid desaturase [Chloroherpetonaceae bacterium]
MLQNKADIRTVAYLMTTTALFFVQWNLESLNPFLYVWLLFMSVSVAVIAHNHNHLPIWKSSVMNGITDYWLTVFYGFPTFAWIPTHNKNHHKFNNREGDYTITYRFTEKNNFWTIISYPTISSYFQQTPIRDFLKKTWEKDKGKFAFYIMQYVALAAVVAVGLWVDWKKAILYILIPHQVALFSVLVFNYLQHVHADETSPVNHSRNFVSPLLNALLFNNGYHTVHHDNAQLHWSLTPEAHAKMAGKIDPYLNVPSFWGYIVKTYFLSPFNKKFASYSLRLERMKQKAAAEMSKAVNSPTEKHQESIHA